MFIIPCRQPRESCHSRRPGIRWSQIHHRRFRMALSTTDGAFDMAMHDGHYPVFWPRAARAAGLSDPAPRLPTLAGKKIAILWDYLFRGDEIFPFVQARLRERFDDIAFIGYETFGSTHGDQEQEIIESLPRRLRELEPGHPRRGPLRRALALEHGKRGRALPQRLGAPGEARAGGGEVRRRAQASAA